MLRVANDMNSFLFTRSPLIARLTERGRGSRRVALLFIALGALAIIWLSIAIPRQISRRESLLRDGKETVGKIEKFGKFGRSSEWWVRYIFTADGKSIRNEVTVPESFVHALSSADSLRILYLPSNPSINHPAEWSWEVLSELPWTLWLAWSVPGFLLLNRLRQERKLATVGVVARGKVTNCSQRRQTIEVAFEFCTSDGVVIEGTGWSPAMHEPGSSIDVLHLLKNPLRAMPYPLENYDIVDGEAKSAK